MAGHARESAHAHRPAEASKRSRLGVCSWSLRPDSPQSLAHAVASAGLDLVQLALDPIRRGEWTVQGTRGVLRDAGIAIASGMIAFEGEDYTSLESIRLTGGVLPDHRWEANLQHARQNAAIARELNIGLVTFHAGFIPADPREPLVRTMVERIAAIARVLAEHDCASALETGQESAQTLEHTLKALRERFPALAVGVNFDPANMVLYGMGEPIASLRALLPWVRQVHAKDARPAGVAGQWGDEVPAGQGVVDWPTLVALVRPTGVDMIIEREAGGSRLDDVRSAVGLLSPLLAAVSKG